MKISIISAALATTIVSTSDARPTYYSSWGGGGDGDNPCRGFGADKYESEFEICFGNGERGFRSGKCQKYWYCTHEAKVLPAGQKIDCSDTNTAPGNANDFIDRVYTRQNNLGVFPVTVNEYDDICRGPDTYFDCEAVMEEDFPFHDCDGVDCTCNAVDPLRCHLYTCEPPAVFNGLGVAGSSPCYDPKYDHLCVFCPEVERYCGEEGDSGDLTPTTCNSCSECEPICNPPLLNPIGADPACDPNDCSCSTNNCPTGMGDPHFKTWGGTWYDFHGECELVFLHAPKFANDTGLDIHIRTKAIHDYSFIESAVVAIGGDEIVLEVGSWGEYFLNGVEAARLPMHFATSGMTLTHVFHDERHQEFNIQGDHSDQILQIKTMKNLVSVSFVGKLNTVDFEGSVGLLGDPRTGAMLARDGVRELSNDPNSFGQEWQVLGTERNLFQNQVAPQYPQKCILPQPRTSSRRRRLGETIAREAAEAACSSWGDDRKEMCVFDVMRTGDIELAHIGAP